MVIGRRQLFLLAGAAAANRIAGASHVPWYNTIRRCGQVNFNERDAELLDIGAWLEFWASLKVDTLFVNAGGIVAFYPTRIPYHHRCQFLGNRDLFGDFSKAAKKRGIRAMARLDPHWAYEDALKAHPQWFARTAEGEPVRHEALALSHLHVLALLYRTGAGHHPGGQFSLRRRWILHQRLARRRAPCALPLSKLPPAGRSPRPAPKRR